MAGKRSRSGGGEVTGKEKKNATQGLEKSRRARRIQ